MSERKYDHSSTGTYSIEDILSELDEKKASPQKMQEMHKKVTVEKTEINTSEACEKSQVETALTSDKDGGHELWIGLGTENTVEAKFDTNEYEPEDFKSLHSLETDDIAKTSVCEIPKTIQNDYNIAFPTDEYYDEEENISLTDLCKYEKRNNIIRLCLGLIPAAALLFLCLDGAYGFGLTELLKSTGLTWLFPAVVGGITMLAVLIYIFPILRGFKSLFSGEPDGNSGIAFSAVASLILPAAAIFYPEMTDTLPIFGISATIGLMLTSVGGLLRVGSRKIALELSHQKEEKRVLIPIEEEQSCKSFLGGMRVVGSEVYEPVRTEEITDMEESFAACGLSDMSLRVMTFISIIGAAATAIADYFLFGKTVPTALTAFTCFALASTALTAPLISSLPFYRASRHLRRFGSTVTGFDAVSEMTQIGSVVVDSNYLFPKNSVVLHGMRTFGSFRIDDAIIDAASVVCASGGALSGVFLSVIDNQRSLLRKVDTIIYEDGLGLSAWVSERRILIGTAELLKNHGIGVPSRDYEYKYRQNGRDLVYVSVGGELTAMFVVSYRVRREIFEEIRALRRHKVGLIIVNRDCNITEDKIAEYFNFPKNMIKILPPSSEHILGKPNYKRCCARIIYSKGIMGLVESIITCLRMSTTVNITNIFQLGGCILGCALIIYLTAVGGLGFFGVGELLLWQGIWGILTLVISFFRKP